MLRRILALAVIFVCTSVAWFVLAGAVFFRTYGAQQVLGSRVATTWGAPLRQKPPVACSAARPLALTASRVDVDVDLQPRQKGLLWYATYALAFRGTYTFEVPPSGDTAVTLRLPLPAADAVYDNIVLEVDGAPVRWEREPARPDAPPALAVTIPPHPGRPIELRAAYRTRGQDTFTYDIGDRAAARDFTLTATTNFAGYDVPEGALSPTSVADRGGAGAGRAGKTLTWRFDNIVSGQPVTLALPQKLQPGPVVGRISLFAPVSLLLFFFVMFVITVVRGVDLHPMNYFFLATAFFAFHLLLAYLVDVIPVAPAFVVASVVSVGLVVSYLRLVAGVRFALHTAGAAQLVYLVLFSAAFFVEGLTGLAVTLVSVATLFVTMQATGRIRWGAKFASAPPAAPAPPVGATPVGA